MIHKEKKYLAATTEVCSLYVDLNSRKVTEFEDEKKLILRVLFQKIKINLNQEI